MGFNSVFKGLIHTKRSFFFLSSYIQTLILSGKYGGSFRKESWSAKLNFYNYIKLPKDAQKLLPNSSVNYFNMLLEHKRVL